MRVWLIFIGLLGCSTANAQPYHYDYLYINSWSADSVVKQVNLSTLNLKGPVHRVVRKSIYSYVGRISNLFNDYTQPSWDTLTFDELNTNKAFYSKVDTMSFLVDGQLRHHTAAKNRVIQYDSFGYPIVSVNNDGDSIFYVFDTLGRLARKEGYNSNLLRYEKFVIEYLGDRVIEAMFVDDYSKVYPVNVSTYYYNPNGTLSRKSYCLGLTNYPIESKPSACWLLEIRYEYNEKQQLVIVREFSDEYGYYIISHSEEKLDSLLQLAHPHKRYTYNDVGQIVEVESNSGISDVSSTIEPEVDSLGRIKYEPSYGWLTKYEYNEQGDVITTEDFQLLSPTEMSKHSILRHVFEYDEFGNPTRAMATKTEYLQRNVVVKTVTLDYVRFTEYEYYK